MASYMNQHCSVPLHRRKLLEMEYFISTFEFMEMYAIYGKKNLEIGLHQLKTIGLKNYLLHLIFFTAKIK